MLSGFGAGISYPRSPVDCQPWGAQSKKIRLAEEDRSAASPPAAVPQSPQIFEAGLCRRGLYDTSLSSSFTSGATARVDNSASSLRRASLWPVSGLSLACPVVLRSTIAPSTVRGYTTTSPLAAHGGMARLMRGWRMVRTSMCTASMPIRSRRLSAHWPKIRSSPPMLPAIV
jgi:hypothetical protein